MKVVIIDARHEAGTVVQ